MYKRFVLIVTSLCLVLVVLTACGKVEDATPTTSDTTHEQTNNTDFFTTDTTEATEEITVDSTSWLTQEVHVTPATKATTKITPKTTTLLTSTPNKKNDDFYYTISNKEVTISSIKSSDILIKGGKITIPDTIEGYPVTIIEGLGEAEDGGVISEIVFPKTLKRIENGAIHASLKKLEFPESLEYIGDEAFDNYMLLGKDSEITLRIPKNVKYIGYNNFFYGKLMIVVDLNNPNYSSKDGLVYNKAGTELLKDIFYPFNICKGNIRDGFEGCNKELRLYHDDPIIEFMYYSKSDGLPTGGRLCGDCVKKYIQTALCRCGTMYDINATLKKSYGYRNKEYYHLHCGSAECAKYYDN